MIGRTNVGGGSPFSATIQVTTDPNAAISAVNLAGDTYEGVADATGALTLRVSKPGTYTITESGGGVETLAVADDGQTYQIEVVAFDGVLLDDGVDTHGIMELVGITYDLYTPNALTISSYSEMFDGGIEYSVVWLNEGTSGRAGAYRTSETIKTNNFSSIKVSCFVQSSFYVAFFDEDDNVEWSQYFSVYGAHLNTPYVVSGFPSGNYRIGVFILSAGSFAINDLILQR